MTVHLIKQAGNDHQKRHSLQLLLFLCSFFLQLYHYSLQSDTQAHLIFAAIHRATGHISRGIKTKNKMLRRCATGKAPLFPPRVPLFSLAFTFVLILCLLCLLSSQASGQENRVCDTPTTVGPTAQEQLAFGFNLGQSYG